MNTNHKLPRFPAGLLALAGFVATFAIGYLMWTNTGNLLVGRAEFAASQVERSPAQFNTAAVHHSGLSDAAGAFVLAVAPFAVALLIYRGTRLQLSRSAVFHSAFFVGLALLGYSLCCTLFFFRIDGLAQSAFDPMNTSFLWPALVVGPFVFLLLIPLALLLVSFATLYDRAGVRVSPCPRSFL